jgi:hypothetical protein
LILFVLLFVGQFVSATLAARFVPGGFTWAESALIGFGMLGRAELFFVVLNMCYVEKDIMPKEMFYTFTFAAMFLNMSVPVCITLFKPVYLRSRNAKKLKALQENIGMCTEQPKRQGTISEFFKNNAVSRMMRRKANKAEINAERRVFHANTANGISDGDDKLQGATTKEDSGKLRETATATKVNSIGEGAPPGQVDS